MQIRKQVAGVPQAGVGRLLSPDEQVTCLRLHCSLPAQDCLLRQAASDAQRGTHEHCGRLDKRRGVASDFPTCETGKCVQGAAIRRELEAAGIRIEWSGAGPNGRFARARADAELQFRARCRLARVGLLDLPPSMDEPPADDSHLDADTA